MQVDGFKNIERVAAKNNAKTTSVTDGSYSTFVLQLQNRWQPEGKSINFRGSFLLSSWTMFNSEQCRMQQFRERFNISVSHSTCATIKVTLACPPEGAVYVFLFGSCMPGAFDKTYGTYKPMLA